MKTGPKSLCGSRKTVYSRACPLFRLTCLQGGIGTVLIICIHHILADGKSGLHILREIAYFLNNPGREAEAVWIIFLRIPHFTPEKDFFSHSAFDRLAEHPVEEITAYLFHSEYITMRNNYWKQKSHTLLAASSITTDGYAPPRM
jgi:hypothetical protein